MHVLVLMVINALTGRYTAMTTVMMLKMLRLVPLIHSMNAVMNSGWNATFSHAFFCRMAATSALALVLPPRDWTASGWHTQARTDTHVHTP